MRNLPLPSPHSLRDFGFFAAALALPRFGQRNASVSVSVVTPPFWETLKFPS